VFWIPAPTIWVWFSLPTNFFFQYNCTVYRKDENKRKRDRGWPIRKNFLKHSRRYSYQKRYSNTSQSLTWLLIIVHWLRKSLNTGKQLGQLTSKGSASPSWGLARAPTAKTDRIRNWNMELYRFIIARSYYGKNSILEGKLQKPSKPQPQLKSLGKLLLRYSHA